MTDYNDLTQEIDLTTVLGSTAANINAHDSILACRTLTACASGCMRSKVTWNAMCWEFCAHLPEKEEDGREKKILVGTCLTQQRHFLLQNACACLALSCTAADNLNWQTSDLIWGCCTASRAEGKRWVLVVQVTGFEGAPK